MDRILLISENPRRSRGLAQDLADGLTCEVHDLYADHAPASRAGVLVPAAILNKPGRLDAHEMAIARRHPEQGYRMWAGQGFGPGMLAVVRSHHEMLDGSGYPDQLKGDDIPDRVRLVTVCDIDGALIERRSYKLPMSYADAIAILEGMMSRLDSAVVNAFRPVAAAFTPLVPCDA